MRTISVKLARDQRCQACGRIHCLTEYETMLCMNTCFPNYLEAEQKVATLIVRYAAAIMRRPDGSVPNHTRSGLREIIVQAETLLGFVKIK